MKHLRWYDHISVNLFWLALNIRNNSINVFLPYLLVGFVDENVRNSALGGIRTAGLVIAMLVQPAMGLLSDRSTSRFGRRRPYIFVGVLLDLIFLAMIAFSWDFGSLLVAILLVQFSGNISHGALQGLIPDLVPEDQRGLASGVKGVMELLPLILVSFTIANIVAAGRFRLAVLVAGAGLLAIMLLTMLLVKETPLIEKPDLSLWSLMRIVVGVLAGIGGGALVGVLAGGSVWAISWLAGGAQAGLFSFVHLNRAQAIGIGLGGMVAMAVAVVTGVAAGVRVNLGGEAARQNRPFTWWMVNRLFFLAAVTSVQTYAPFFLMFAFKIEREAAAKMNGQLLVAVGLSTLLTALPGGWLSDRFGHRRLAALSGWMGALGTAMLLGAIWVPRLWLLYVAGIILGLAVGLFTATNWALGTTLVPRQEAGRYLGISNLAGAGAGMIGTGIGGPVADALNGYLPGLGYFALFACYAGLLVLSVVSLRGVKEEKRLATEGTKFAEG
jgi:MFS family permease